MYKLPPRATTPSWISEHIPEELAGSTLFRFHVTLPSGGKLEIDLLQDIDVNYELLEQQLEHAPAQYVWYASMLAELKSLVYVWERKCKAKRGLLTSAALEAARSVGMKPTAEQVKAIIEADDTLNQLEGKLATVQKHANKLHHMVEAIKMKSEHLRSLAGFKRQEREAQR